MLDRLLHSTSRTFALSIPLLPEGVRDEITVAYLLFRVADTLEDEPSWSPQERADALGVLSGLLAAAPSEVRDSIEIMPRPVTDGAYAELLDNFATVHATLATLSPEARGVIVGHLRRTIEGMRTFLVAEEGVSTLAEVREYCYYVAGIVGELCTSLFILNTPSLARRSDELVALAPSFGEALQLVNILRDEQDDAADGRRYIPEDQARSELMAIANADLGRASDYVALLEEAGADTGIVAFNALNLILAYATLARVQQLGAGAKLSRDEVKETLEAITGTRQRGHPIVPLVERARVRAAEAMATQRCAAPDVAVRYGSRSPSSS
jgi:farnesyl-diphosphate farnesyltransferase